MPSTFRAAKTLCALSGWSLSNLQLQKLLYLSHMVMLAEHNNRLIDGQFEAWDLGPVEPKLYHKVKAYGSRPIPDIFPGDVYLEGEPEYSAITSIWNQLKNATPGRLVSITHWNGGAWATHYKPMMRGIPIPDADIRAEYHKLAAKTNPAPAA